MQLDLQRYREERRRLQRITSALLIPGTVLAAVGVLWLCLWIMIGAFHEEMQQEAAEDYWLILGTLLVAGLLPTIASVVMLRIGLRRRGRLRRLRDLAALFRARGAPTDAEIERELAWTAAVRVAAVAHALERGVLSPPAGGAGDLAAAGDHAVFNETYEVQEALCRSDDGAVYRVRHVRTDQPYALTTFVPGPDRAAAVIERRLQDSVTASELDHPGLVRVVDVDTTEDGLPFVVADWLEGETLAAREDRDGPLPAEEQRVVEERIGAALEALEAIDLRLADTPPARVFLARGPAGQERAVLLHVGHLRPRRG